jgi:hypothetical protein
VEKSRRSGADDESSFHPSTVTWTASPRS